MLPLSSHHCHTTFVDGKSTAEEMVNAAIEKGFVSMGFSDHGQQHFDPAYSLSDENNLLYINEVNRLKAAYADRISIHLGVERDAFSYSDRNNYEYIIGACHNFVFDTGFSSVDGDLDRLRRYIRDFCGGDGNRMAVDFFELTGRYAEEYKPDVFAHFDLVKLHNKDGSIYDINNKDVLDAEYAALDKVFASGAILEINTGGMARSNQPLPYPEPHVLRRWHDMGGRIVIGSDCHFAPQIDYAFDFARQYAIDAGFKSAWRLGAAGEELFTEYPL